MLKSYTCDDDMGEYVELGEKSKFHLQLKFTFTSYHHQKHTFVNFDMTGYSSANYSFAHFKDKIDLHNESLVFMKGSNTADFTTPEGQHMQFTWCSDQGKVAAYIVNDGGILTAFDLQEVGSDSAAADSAAADSDATDSTTAADPTSTIALIENIKPHLPKFAEPLNFDIRACAAEGLAMMLFVIIGCGTAMSVAKESGWLLQVSLAFGLAITSLAYTVGNYSGGQINSAVTIGLVVMGHISVMQAIGNIVFQVLGS